MSLELLVADSIKDIELLERYYPGVLEQFNAEVAAQGVRHYPNGQTGSVVTTAREALTSSDVSFCWQVELANRAEWLLAQACGALPGKKLSYGSVEYLYTLPNGERRVFHSYPIALGRD